MSKPPAPPPPPSRLIWNSKTESLLFAGQAGENRNLDHHSVYTSFAHNTARDQAEGEFERYRLAQKRLLQTSFEQAVTNEAASAVLEAQAKGKTGDPV
jgi:hypothetical protein